MYTFGGICIYQNLLAHITKTKKNTITHIEQVNKEKRKKEITQMYLPNMFCPFDSARISIL